MPDTTVNQDRQGTLVEWVQPSVTEDESHSMTAFSALGESHRRMYPPQHYKGSGPKPTTTTCLPDKNSVLECAKYQMHCHQAEGTTNPQDHSAD
jgi:hypothetical protein